MEEMKLLGTILDIGVALTQSGAETHRVEDTLYRLTESYGFRECNIWVVPSNIQGTVTTASDESITQIRHIRQTGVDFDKLDRLNTLSRYACSERPAVNELKERLSNIERDADSSIYKTYLGGVMAGAGFGVLFNCDGMDAFVAAIVSLLITFLIRQLSARERNPLIRNFIIAFIAECLILLSVQIGIGHHVGTITVGVIMLLISALGITNGIRDLVHLDTLSGVMNITVSLAGAIGIALGIATPLYLLREQAMHEIMSIEPNIWIQLLACTIGAAGFAIWFHVKGKRILFCTLGAFLTWSVYIWANPDAGIFRATLYAAVFCGMYAQILARLNKAPATIFMTIAIFPLVPGASLYYTVYGTVINNQDLVGSSASQMGQVCFGIVMGFLIVEVISRYIWRGTAKPIKQIEKGR